MRLVLIILFFYSAKLIIKVLFNIEKTELNNHSFKIQYLSNDNILSESFLKHYLKILDLENEPILYREKIITRSREILEYTKDDILNGFKTKNSLKDIRTAQAFLIDLFDYLENKN